MRAPGPPDGRATGRIDGLPFFYGWVVVFAAALGMFATGPGQTFAVAVFVDPMRLELGVSRTAISSAYSIAGLAAAAVVVVLGRMIDRLGGRRALVVFGATLGVACLGMSQVSSFVGLAAGLAALRMLGPGGLSLGCSVLAAHWFVRRRGLAVGLVLLGVAISQAMLPPLTQQWVGQHGWRATWIILGLLVWVVVVLPAALFVRDRPEAVGLRPDGESGRQRGAFRTGLRPPLELDWSPSQAAHTRTFWLLLLVGATPSLVTTGITFHQVSYLAERGLEGQLGVVFALLAGSTALGMFLAGPVLDRVEMRAVQAALLCLLIVGVLLLTAVGSVWGAVVAYPLALGLTSGGLHTAGGVVWAVYYGRRHLGALRGIDGAVKMTAAAFGPLPLALARDQFGSYGPGLICFAALAVLGMLAALGCRPPVQRGAAKTPGAERLETR